MPWRFASYDQSGFVVNDVSFGRHSPMQDAGNQNASGVLAVKHDVPANLHTTQAAANVIAVRPDAGLSASIWQHASRSPM